MANPSHIRQLRTGISAWNAWRAESPSLRPDLSGVDLSKDLRSALERSKRSEEKRVGVDLSNSDLSGSLLDRCNLVGSFAGARINGTHFKKCIFSGCDFTNAQMSGTYFIGCNLSSAINLPAVIHLGPSVVDHETLFQSPGLPEIFLRGCGFPDSFIAFAKDQIVSGIEFYSCFLSFSSADEEFARRLFADLQMRGIRTWFAPEDLKIGNKFRQDIDEAIRVRDKLLVILSEHSICSPWVESEVETAFEEERRGKRLVLFPIQIDDAIKVTSAAWASELRRTRHIGNFNRWKEHESYTNALERLLRDLRASRSVDA